MSSRRRSRWPGPKSSSRRSKAANVARRLLAEVADRYDYILIDCPPSLGLLTVNALTAADSVLIPLQCEYYALEGLTQLLATLDLVRDHLNPTLAIKGVVLTMFDGRTNLSADVAAEVRRHLGDRVFDTVIPRNVRLSEAPSHGLPISRYSPGFDAARSRTRRWRPSSGADGMAAMTETATDDDSRSRMRRGRRDRPDPSAPQGLGRGLACAHPATDRWSAERARDPDHAHPPEPASAAQELRRRRARVADREHQRARRPAADPRDRDRRRLPARRRRAHGCAPPRRPASTGSRRSSASSPIATSSSSPSSRTCSATTSTRSRRRTPTASSSRSSGSPRTTSPHRVGRARSTVANTLRLLDLAPGVQAAVADGRLTEGHGRALGGLAVEFQDRVLDSVIGQELSVRQTEELVRRLREPKPEPTGPLAAPNGSRARARRGGPPARARHQGQPRRVRAAAAGS